MTRLIDADALRDALQYEIDKVTPPFDDTVGAVRCGIRLARNIAEDQPTVEAVPVVHGKWIHRPGSWFHNDYQCSECGNYLDFNGLNAGRGDANFCPNCGARMDTDETES